jgi:hypothetical protein
MQARIINEAVPLLQRPRLKIPMNNKVGEELLRIFGFILLVLSSFFWFFAFRFASFPLLILAWVLLIKLGRSDLRPSLLAWAGWLALTFSPIDIFPIPPKTGRPRLVPLVMGLPRPETIERAKRGEVILGGCLVSGFEPKYYLVW